MQRQSIDEAFRAGERPAGETHTRPTISRVSEPLRWEVIRWLPWALVALVAIIILPSLLAELAEHGDEIQREVRSGDYWFGVFWSVLLGASILAWPIPRRHKRPLLLIWAAKAVVALTFMLVYEAHYRHEMDAYQYFARSNSGTDPWKDISFTRSGSIALITTLSWIQSELLYPSYHAVKATFGMFGLVAVYVFYRGCEMYRSCEDRWALYALGLFPSILFWSSTLGKEPLALLGVGLYAYGAIGWLRNRRLVYLAPRLRGCCSRCWSGCGWAPSSSSRWR